MRRRSLLGRISLLGMAAAVLAIVGLGLGGDGPLTGDQRAAAQTAPPPNFVFVMTDDLDERSMQNLAGIRALMGSNGTTFTNAYVTYSLCCPSRATILRGQYPHNHDIVDNRPPLGGEGKFRELGRDRSTIATWLNDAGYRTKYIGKYLNGYNDLYKPLGWDEWFVLNVAKDTINDDGKSIALTAHSTDVFADEASEFIRRSSASPNPFFVLIGTKAPHTPPEVATRHQDAFATTPLPKPPNFNEADVSDKPAWVRSRNLRSQTEIDEMEEEYRERLRSMLSVEDLLNQTVATLKETGELSNTYIVFTSDNGYHFANHRLPMSKRTPYEEDIGVPLIVRGPGVPAGALRNQLVLNNDFAPTIADLAGASVPAFVDGKSFAPLLTGSPPSSWRTAFLEEGWYPENGGSLLVPTHKSVHTKRYMFTKYDTGEYELYDLVADPYQLVSKSRAGNEALYSALQTRLDSLRTCTGANCRAAEWDGDITLPPPDTTAPKVISTVPGANATEVASATNVTATFSEDMDSSTINVKTFKLFESGSITKLSATISYSASTDTATLDPTNPLRAGVTYKAVVTTGSMDIAGNLLDQDGSKTGLQSKAWSFTAKN
jgi:N-acetylglucosamine-6-sulfatase